MPIHFECPHCTFPFAVPNEAEGTTFNCTSCGLPVVVPAPPPPPLPPIELIGAHRHVLGKRTFPLWEILGIYTDWSANPSLTEVFRFIAGLLFPATLVLIVLVTISDTATADRADSAAPWFFALFFVALIIAYCIAVNRVSQDEPRGPLAVRRFSMYLFNPAAMVISEFHRALPVYRFLVLAIALLVGGLIVAQRAGGPNHLLPPLLRGLHLFPEHAPPPDSDNGTYQSMTWPPPGATTESAASQPVTPRNHYYNPENGPPPPPR